MSATYLDPGEGFALFVMHEVDPRLGNREEDSLILSRDGRFTLIRHTLTAGDLLALMRAQPIVSSLRTEARTAMRIDDDISAAGMQRSDLFLFSRRPGDPPHLVRNLDRRASAGVFRRLLEEHPDHLVLCDMTDEEVWALLDLMTPPGEGILPVRPSAPRVQPSPVTAPIPARSDDGALFSLLADVGCRPPSTHSHGLSGGSC